MMTLRTRLSTCVVLALCLITAGCSNTDTPNIVANGIGGTGKAPIATSSEAGGGIGGTGITNQNGIGGTGKAGPDEGGSGGIGGTGKIAGNGLGGTGIIGTISKFGSIWVNNARITYDENTPITIDGKPAKRENLKLGHMVAVLSDKANSDYQARSIDIVHEVIGPIAGIDIKRQRLIVLGQLVQLRSNTRIIEESTGKALKPEQLSDKYWLRASGLRNKAGTIIASRLDVFMPKSDATAQIIGHLQINGEGQYQVAGKQVSLADWLKPEDLDRRVMATGKLSDNTFIVESIGKDGTQRVLEEANEILVEGFISFEDMDDIIQIGDLDFELPEDIPDEMFDQFDLDSMPIQVMGTLMDGEMLSIDDIMVFDDAVEFIDMAPEDVMPDDILLDDEWIEFEPDYFE